MVSKLKNKIEKKIIQYPIFYKFLDKPVFLKIPQNLSFYPLSTSNEVFSPWWRVDIVCVILCMWPVVYNGYSVLRELLIASPVLSQYHTERGNFVINDSAQVLRQYLY